MSEIVLRTDGDYYLGPENRRRLADILRTLRLLQACVDSTGYLECTVDEDKLREHIAALENLVE